MYFDFDWFDVPDRNISISISNDISICMAEMILVLS